jgi:dTDP-4-dehydrorhamnose 3,5-epimerase
VYIPERFAHGYQALEEGTETMYEVGQFYCAEAEGGLAYDDPGLAIEWPLPVTEASAKDRAWRRITEIAADLRARMHVDYPRRPGPSSAMSPTSSASSASERP